MTGKPTREQLDLRIRALEKEVMQFQEMKNRLAGGERGQAEIIEHLPDATYVIDTRGQVIVWNRAMEKLCGVKAKDMVGQGNFAYALSLYGKNQPVLIDLVLKWEEEIANAYPFIQKDGEVLITETRNPPFRKKPCVLRHRAQPVYGSDGAVIGAVEVIRDITVWRLAEERLKNREELLRICVDHTPATVVMCDKDMRWQAYSRRCIEDYRLELKNYVGANHYDIVPDLPPRWKEDHQRVLSGEQIHVEEEKFQRKDGQVEWVKRDVMPWRDAEGDIGGILIFNEIITQRKQAEERLIQSEQRFREMADHIDEVFWVFDCKKRRRVYVSPAYENIWGRSVTDVYQRYESWGESIHPDDLATAQEAFEKIVRTGGGETKEYRIVRPDGQIRWISDRGFAVRDQAGAVVRVVGIAEDTTEQKQAEESLRISEANYRELFNAEPDAIIIADISTKQIIDVNRSALDLYGYSRSEIIGLDPIRLSAEPEKSAEHIKKVIVLIAEGKRIDTEERLHKKKDGTVFPVEIATGAYTSEGTTMICAMIRDITVRRQKEDAIGELQIQQEAILNNIPDIAWLKDEMGRFIAVNKAFGAACGANPEELVGKTDLDIWPQELAESYRSDDSEVMKTGRRKVVDEPLAAADGQTTWIETIKTPIHDEKGVVIGTTGIARDITDRKKAEMALRESEERFAKAFHNSPDAIVITRVSDGCVLEANDSFFQLSGYGREEVIDRTSTELGLWVDPKDRQHYLEGLQKTGNIRDQEYRFRIKSGEVRYGRVSGSLLNVGGVPCVLGTIRDITETRRMENEILKVEKLESLGVLAGGIAHDFNNFLAGIIGNLSLAKLETTATDSILERLEEMEKAAMRAKNLTQQLLTFSKGGEPVRRIADLTHLVKESSLFAVRGSSVRCAFNFESGSLFSEVDEGQLAQVIHNLTLNAVQAMPEGGDVHIGGERIELPENNSLSLDAGQYLKVSIRDHGTGIKKEHLKKIFDPYFTTKQKGSGLGLAVAHSVIEKHGGRITLDSELGIGTTFAIYLPELQKGDVQKQAESRVLKAAGGSILVMDDEDIIRKLATQMLEKMGFGVTVARSGEEALRLYHQAFTAGQAFDAVILDLTVPGGMGGKETIGKLLELDPNVKAIVSSGYSNDPVLSNYTRYGFRQAVGKPYRIQELSDALHAVLQPPKPDA